MKKVAVLACLLVLAAAMVFSACSGGAEISGVWTDPVTGNKLSMDDGKFTVTDPGGIVIDQGTYDVGKQSNQYDMTLSNGETSSATVSGTKVEFTGMNGTTTVYEDISVD